MSTPHKPNTYSTVSPYFIADGASDTIPFLKSVFGASVAQNASGGKKKQK